MLKETTSVRLRKDQIATINELGINLSEWVREKIDEELISLEKVQENIKNTKKKLKKLHEIEANVLQCNTVDLKRQSNEIPFLLETKVLLEKKPEFLEGRIELYKRMFNISKQVSKRAFMELLEETYTEDQETSSK